MKKNKQTQPKKILELRKISYTQKKKTQPIPKPKLFRVFKICQQYEVQ